MAKYGPKGKSVVEHYFSDWKTKVKRKSSTLTKNLQSYLDLSEGNGTTLAFLGDSKSVENVEKFMPTIYALKLGKSERRNDLSFLEKEVKKCR